MVIGAAIRIFSVGVESGGVALVGAIVGQVVESPRDGHT